MSQKNREPGWYWIKIYRTDEYEVAQFAENGIWYLNRSPVTTCEDSMLFEIDECRIVREEPTE